MAIKTTLKLSSAGSPRPFSITPRLGGLAPDDYASSRLDSDWGSSERINPGSRTPIVTVDQSTVILGRSVMRRSAPRIFSNRSNLTLRTSVLSDR